MTRLSLLAFLLGLMFNVGVAQADPCTVATYPDSGSCSAYFTCAEHPNDVVFTAAGSLCALHLSTGLKGRIFKSGSACYFQSNEQIGQVQCPSWLGRTAQVRQATVVPMAATPVAAANLTDSERTLVALCDKGHLSERICSNYFDPAPAAPSPVYKATDIYTNLPRIEPTPRYTYPSSSSTRTVSYAPGCAENGSCYGDTSGYTGAAKTVQVQGYYRADGTYVRGHYRSPPR